MPCGGERIAGEGRPVGTGPLHTDPPHGSPLPGPLQQIPISRRGGRELAGGQHRPHRGEHRTHMGIPVRVHSQNHLPRRAMTRSLRSRRRTGHGRSGHAPSASGPMARRRHRAASGGQNREDATTIGRPPWGHAPPPGTDNAPSPANGQHCVIGTLWSEISGVRPRTRDSTRSSSRQPQHPHPKTLSMLSPSPRHVLDLTPADRYTAQKPTPLFRSLQTRVASPRLSAARGSAPTCRRSGRRAVARCEALEASFDGGGPFCGP